MIPIPLVTKTPGETKTGYGFDFVNELGTLTSLAVDDQGSGIVADSWTDGTKALVTLSGGAANTRINVTLTASDGSETQVAVLPVEILATREALYSGGLATPFEDAVAYVAPEVPHCPNPVIVDALRNAALRFCSEAHLWRYDLSAITPVAGQDEYPLIAPEGAQISAVLRVVQGTDELTAATEKILSTSSRDAQTHYSLPSLRTLRLWPTPTAQSAAVTVTVALRPELNGSLLGTEVWRNYQLPLIAGAKSELMLQPGKPWSNPDYAAIYRSEFEQGIAAAKRQANKGNTTGELRVSFFPLGG